MGYYTRYGLDISFYNHGKNEPIEDPQLYYQLGEALVLIEKELEDMSGYDCLFDQEIKWYDYDQHMKQISHKYPDILFILEGEGEETGDIWKAYYLQGKVQREVAKIQIAPFNPEELK